MPCECNQQWHRRKVTDTILTDESGSSICHRHENLPDCFTIFLYSLFQSKLIRDKHTTQTNHCCTTAMARLSSPILFKRLRDANLLRRRILLSRAIFILRHGVSRPQYLPFHASSPIFSHRNSPNHHMGPLSLDDNHKHHPRDVLLDSNGH